MTHVRLLLVSAALALFPAVLPAQLTWHKAGAEPGPRAAHYAFFDLARGRTTLFGGQDTPTSYASDCWQLDDRDWVQFPPQALAPRAHGAACEDPVGGEGLIFGGRDNTTGGLFSETLRWNRELARFDLLAPATSPPPRWVTAMAYDSARHRAVLFGGGYEFGALGDTWEWDGTNWQQRFPAQSPPARANHTMAYDAARGRVVLYGGHNGASLGDTWVYDGTTWTNVSPASSPDRVHNAMLAYDTIRSHVVLFGGKDDSGMVKDSAWTWNGTSWSGPLAPAQRPPARELGSLTYDQQRRRLVLFGGAGQGGTLLSDAWALEGTVWTKLQLDGQGTVVEPPPRTSAVMAYSDVTNKTVLFGGVTYANGRFFPLTDTWESAGKLWQQRTPPTGPPGAFASAGVVLRSTGDLYYFPGRDAAGNHFNQQWNWGGQQWSPLTLSVPPITPLVHQVVGSLQSSLYGWVLVRLVTSGTAPNLTSTLQLIQPFSGNVAAITVPGGPGPRVGSVMVQTHSASIAGNKLLLFGGSDQNGVYQNDLWELADTGSGGNLAWTQIVPAAGSPVPPARSNAAVAYYGGTRVAVMGGSSASGDLGDSWMFDLASRQWSQVAGVGPSARRGAQMTYDASIARVVLLGGFDGATARNDIWECDGTVWTPRVTPGKPTARFGASLVHDRGTHRSIAFSGANINTNSAPGIGDTWSYDGTSWSPVVGSGKTPSPRLVHAACFDEMHGAMVIFGGLSASSRLGDTHVLSNTGTWTQGANGPPARIASAMVYVASQQHCLLFGGAPAGPGVLGDTWTYSVATGQWSSVLSGPPARYYHAMAYDRLRDRVVLTGGLDASLRGLRDTWEYQAATGWQMRMPVHSHPGYSGHSMAYDEARARTVLSLAEEVWEWDGSDWLHRAPETLTVQTFDSGCAYDSGRQRVLLLGGQDGRGGTLDTLRDFGARIDVAGRGNTASPEGLRYYSQPTLGQQLQLGFANPQGLGCYMLGFGPLQQPLFQFGAPLCETSSIYANLVSYLVLGNSEPSAGWQVPNTPLILGVTLVFQAFALQPANCWRATDALHVRF